MELDQELEALINSSNAPAAPPTPAAAPAAPAGSDKDFMSAMMVDDETTDETGATTIPAAAEAPAPADPSSFAGVDMAAVAEMARSNAALAAQIAESRAAAAAPKAPDAKPLFDAADLDLTAEEAETYKASQSIIARLANRAVQNYHDKAIKPLQDQINAMSSRTEQAERTALASNEGAFLAQIKAAVPQLSSLAKTPAWQSYLKQPAPMTGGKASIENMLQHNISQKNLEAIVEIVSGFAAPAVAAGQSVAPGRARTTTPLKTPDQRPKKFAYSKFVDLSERVRTGQAPYSELQRVEAEMFQAEADGRVDYNA